MGITLDVRAADSYLQLKQKEPALQLFDLAIAVAARVPSGDLNIDNASSMLPTSSGGGDPGVTIPPAHSINESLAWAHLYRRIGYWQQRQSQPMRSRNFMRSWIFAATKRELPSHMLRTRWPPTR